MDFTFTPEQDEAAELAAKILGDRATNERMKAVEADGSRFDRDLWAELGSAGLLGLALPEEYDGAGLGLVELCRVLVEVGRTVAPGAARRARPGGAAAGRARQRRARSSSGCPVRPPAATCSPRRSPRSARSRPSGRRPRPPPDGDGYRLTGSKAIVPAGPVRRRCSWCPPRRRPAWASSWSSPATPA